MSQEKTAVDVEKSHRDKSSPPNEDSQLAADGELHQIAEQERIASVLAFEFAKVEHLLVREALVEHLRHIDEGLAERVAKELALEKKFDAPEVVLPTQEMESSPVVGKVGKMDKRSWGVTKRRLNIKRGPYGTDFYNHSNRR